MSDWDYFVVDDDPPLDPGSIARMISEGRARQLDRAVDQIEELTAERNQLSDRWALAVAERDAAEAERDRLRAEKAHLVEVNAALRTRPDLAERAPLVVALAEERDLLRDRYAATWNLYLRRGDVVEAARTWRASLDRPLSDITVETHRAHVAAVDGLIAALDQLDGKEGNVSEPYEDWDHDLLVDEVRALVATVERIEAERDRLRAAARDLVAAAKGWARAHMDPGTSESERLAHVQALARSVDAFDPMLSETTDPLDVSANMGREDGDEQPDEDDQAGLLQGSEVDPGQVLAIGETADERGPHEGPGARADTGTASGEVGPRVGDAGHQDEDRRNVVRRGAASVFDLTGETIMGTPLIDVDAAVGDAGHQDEDGDG